MGDLGTAITDMRGFLADPLDRFGQINRQARQPGSTGGLGDYIAQQGFDPTARLQQVQFGSGGSWGNTVGALPGLDYLDRLGSRFADPWGRDAAIKEARVAKPGQNTGPGSSPLPGPAPSSAPGSGGGWTGPATAADNATLTPDKVEQVIAQTRANSPLKGKGAWLLSEANKRNISLPLFMGIMLAESELGTTAGPGWGALVGLGGAGNLGSYGSLEEAALAGMDNLASSQYQPLSLEAKIGYWFPGPQEWAAHGLDASDGQNGTVRDYISGKVAPMYAAFGVPFQQAAAPTRQAATPGAGVTPSGYSFPVVGFKGPVQLHHGAEAGASDIFAAEGTNVVAMRGGKVVDAGWNSLGGNTVTIVGDDGLTYYYAHLRDAPLVAAGQQIQAGGALGYVGQTGNAQGTGAHLHLGIGKTILSGAGPQGGAGTSWGDGPFQNAVGLLNWVLGGGQPTGGAGGRNY